ncbi:MAG: TlpA family protein disulfide reductase [Verrucomicrobia bacterium]|nr:TlpA family protein disulfide reductase [Verrucomicrobiota bacterium]
MITPIFRAGIRSRTPNTPTSLTVLALAAGAAVSLGSTLMAEGQDSFAARTLLTGSEASDTGDFSTGTWEFQEPVLPESTAGRSLWWTWVAPGAGEVQVQLMGFLPDFSDELDTVLGVFTGDSLAALTLVDFNDDESTGLSSQCRFVATPGTAYHFLADLHSFEVATGSAYLSVSFEASSGERPDNDNFSTATPLTGANASDASTFRLATREAGEPFLPFRARGRTLWWSWTPEQEGLALVELGGTGPSPDTVVGIYTGNSLENLQLLTAEDEGGPNHGSLAAFLTVPGVTYYLQADLYDDGEIATGPVEISATLQSLPDLSLRPANDAFARATVLDGIAGRSEANTQYATGENYEPSSHGGTRSQSVWWRYTAPKAGVLRLRTHSSTTSSGAPLDTVLALYSGGSLRTLEELETNDDAGSLLTSELSAYVEAGQEYFVAIAPVVGSPAGLVRLDYQLLDSLPAPSWTARGLDNAVVRSSEFAGSVQLVNLWATWCGPCLAEIPDLVSLYEQYRSQGFVVIGVSVDNAVAGTWPTSLVADFVADYQITYPVVLDQPSGTVEAGFGHASAIPTTYLINREGKIIQKLVGARSRNDFERLILPHLSTASAMPTLGAVPLADGRVQLSWEAQPNLELQAGSSLAGPWVGVTASPVNEGNRQVVTVALEPSQAFYRLSRP